MEKFFLHPLKSLKKEVGSISQRFGSPDPDQRQNFTDPQHWLKEPLPPPSTATSLLDRASPMVIQEVSSALVEAVCRAEAGTVASHALK